MIIPKGQAIYENMNSSFAQFGALLAEQKTNHLTGYIRVTAWDYEGILILDNGTTVSAIDETNGRRASGTSAAERIATQAREKDAALSVYRLSDEIAELLAGLYNSELLYKDLASDFTSLERLIAKLKEERHTGYIEIRMTRNQGAAVIFLREGEAVESFFANDGDVFSGLKTLDQIIQSAEEGALFSVYRADLAQVYKRNVKLDDSFARQEMLSLWQEVLKTIEAAVDDRLKQELFLTAFDRARIDQAKNCPFLDPFAAEFEYQEGQIRFNGQATVAELNEGLSQCVAQTVRTLAAEPMNKGLLGKLQPAMNVLKTKYGDHFERMGLIEALPELFNR
jgi:hypothetical protein